MITKKQAAKAFGSVMELCRKLGINPSTYYRWGRYPPEQWQALIESKISTTGEVK